LKIITKKINNTLIFYDKDIEINIEELFRSGFFSSEDIKNVEWINEDKWVKKHYIRKGMMSFFKDKYLYVDIKNTRSFREFEILNYLHRNNFNTCRPILGWATYHGAIYRANLVTEAIQARTLKDLLDLLATGLGVVPMDTFNSHFVKYERPALFKKIGSYVAEMHNLNVFHGDLNVNNIMVSGVRNKNERVEQKIWIIDFDKSKKTSSTIKESKRLSNIDRFERSLRKTNHFDHTSFTEFLEGYQSQIKG
tara:strand:- start:405 stop:1157 length:753 start_codon:yes stop_codon:yes gene_type:complete